MISVIDILLLHQLSIEEFGGSHGLRDESLLLSAIARPFQTFDGKELYPAPIEKAAALGESLIINHPFVDGNKRTGMLGMLTLLKAYDITLTATDDELYNFIVDISTGSFEIKDITTWLQEHI